MNSSDYFHELFLRLPSRATLFEAGSAPIIQDIENYIEIKISTAFSTPPIANCWVVDCKSTESPVCRVADDKLTVTQQTLRVSLPLRQGQILDYFVYSVPDQLKVEDFVVVEDSAKFLFSEQKSAANAILQRHFNRSFLPQDHSHHNSFDGVTKNIVKQAPPPPSSSPILFSPTSLSPIPSSSPLSQSQSSSSLSQISSPSSSSSEKKSTSVVKKPNPIKTAPTTEKIPAKPAKPTAASSTVSTSMPSSSTSSEKNTSHSHSHSHWWISSYLNLWGFNFMKPMLARSKKEQVEEKEMVEIKADERNEENEENIHDEDGDELENTEEQPEDNDILARVETTSKHKHENENVRIEKTKIKTKVTTTSTQANNKADVATVSKTPIKMIWFAKRDIDGNDSQKEDLRKKRNEEMQRERDEEEKSKKEMREDIISMLRELKVEAAKLPSWPKERHRLIEELYCVVFNTPWVLSRALCGVESRTEDAKFYLACRYYVASHNISNNLGVPVSFLNQLPSKKSPLDKIDLVIKAMKEMCEQMKTSHSECSADDLLICFIECVASCDVKNLVTERAFMEAYLPPEVRKDEEGFALVNLTGAMKIIEQEEESVNNDI